MFAQCFLALLLTTGISSIQGVQSSTTTFRSVRARSPSEIQAVYGGLSATKSNVVAGPFQELFSSGTDNNHDLDGQTTPVEYSPSTGTCPAVAEDWVSLTEDVGANMQLRNPGGFNGGNQQYTMTSETSPIDGINYEATLQIGVQNALNGNQAADLVNLLTEVSVDLFDLTNQQGYGYVALRGTAFGSAFIAYWIYTAVINGGAHQCG